jgi:hypothetical protein
VDFFFDQSQLVEGIKRDEGVRGLKPNVAQEQALTVILHSLLDARRRELCGRTEYEERIWRKLWPISKGLMQEFQEGHGRPRPPGYRCSREHAAEIRLRILRDMPNDPSRAYAAGSQLGVANPALRKSAATQPSLVCWSPAGVWMTMTAG